MEQIAEEASTEQDHGDAPLQTLTSGRKREVRGGAFQAHICVVGSTADVKKVMDAFQRADGFRSVTCWSYAYRINAVPPGQASAEQTLAEGSEDGLDEGSGQKILGVLRRFSLQQLLLVVSRWQDYGASSGLDLFGTELYGIVVERCKDLIATLKQAVGLSEPQLQVVKQVEQPPPRPRNFDFTFLPPLPEPRVPMKYGPNHFLCDTELNRPASLPHLFSGGDVRLWMANDQALRNLPESEIWAMRFLRQPDYRIERVLRAVAALRGQKVPASASTPAGRWGHYREVIKSPTLRTELLLFDASTVSLEAARHALELMNGLEAVDIQRVSAGAAALFDWAQGIARWRLEGPSSFESAEKRDAITLEPLQPREAVLRKAASCPMLRPQLTSMHTNR